MKNWNAKNKKKQKKIKKQRVSLIHKKYFIVSKRKTFVRNISLYSFEFKRIVPLKKKTKKQKKDENKTKNLCFLVRNSMVLYFF